MNVEGLAEIVERMIIEHDYPGFEPRALKLGLPQAAVNAPVKVFGAALMYNNVFVKLAALRWFQDNPKIIRSFIENVLMLLDDSDDWVRFEALRTLERNMSSDAKTINKVASLLKDPNEMVRKEAAKVCGKLVSKTTERDEAVVNLLLEAAQDPSEQVRFKAQKALRRIGAYSGSS
jgi:HEAT repeat protein